MDGMTPVYASEEEAAAAAEKKKKEAEDARHRELVSLAKERFAAAQEAESEIRKLADDDIRFRAGEQWDAQVLAQRAQDKRPALVINRMPQFERQVTNEQRQSKPAIQVSPVDSDADRETAEVLQGLIRHIESDSSADVAYDTALTCAVRGGIGYLRAITEYEDEGSFDQALKVKRVRDPFSVYMDPGAQEQDGSDANWAFVVDDGISKEEFKANYPDCEPMDGGWGDRTTSNGYTCQVVEYFYRERVEDELLLLQAWAVDESGNQALNPETGEPIPMGAPIKMFRSDAEAQPERLVGTTLLDSRPTHRIRVKWAKIAGSKVIEETEFPSKYIPVVPVLGDELWVGGKRVLEGIIRNAKDPQRMYNYWSTAITEAIALAPKAPYIAAEGQLGQHAAKWKEAATRNVPYLEYTPKSIGGSLAPPPQRQAFEAPIQAMTMAMQFAADDMKATTGIYDAALGNRSNESSGRAILARQNQSQVSSLHFSDNLQRAMRHLGRILIEAIPRVYGGDRVVRILGEDKSEKLAALNGAAPVENWQKRAFDISTGRYDVTVSMGPSYTSKRQEAAATQMEFMRVYPNAAPVIGDMLAENMDWPGAKKMAQRLKKMLPPGIAEPDENQKVDPGQLQQQLAQLSQQQEQLVSALNQAQDALETKALELQSSERKDLIAKHADLAKAFASTPAEDALGREVLLMEMHRIEQRLNGFFPPAPPTPNQQQGGVQ
jgi:hypothetical protein